MRKFILTISLLGGLAPSAWCVPQVLNFQGRLLESGASVNGSRAMTFKIFDAASGGNQLFAENRSVNVSTGVFNVLVGDATTGGVPLSVFNGGDRYIEVQVGAQTLPRQRVVSVGYSFRSHAASFADHASTAAFAERARFVDAATIVNITTITATTVNVTSITVINLDSERAHIRKTLKVGRGSINLQAFDNDITFDQNVVVGEGVPTIRTAELGFEFDPSITGATPLFINAGLSGGLFLNTWGTGPVVMSTQPAGRVGIGTTGPAAKLDVTGNAQFGSGAAKSTFTATGALQLANNANIQLSGSAGTITSASSVTASAFFGNGSNLTGVSASQMAAANVTPGTFVSGVNLPAAGVLAGSLGSEVIASSIAVGSVNFSTITAALNLKAPISNPVFTGQVRSPIYNAPGIGSDVSLITEHNGGGNGGHVNLTAGSGTDNGVGGSVKIKSGTAFSNGVAGAITITAANAGFGGGPIDITAGNSVNTGGANVTLGSGSGSTTNGSVIFNIAGTEKARIGGNGNVGIGTTVPDNKLHVVNAVPGALKIVDTTQGTGKVLTSDANGVATWQTVAAASVSADNVTPGTFVSGVNLPAAGVLAGSLSNNVIASSIAVSAINFSTITAALNLKAPISNPVFTGQVRSPIYNAPGIGSDVSLITEHNGGGNGGHVNLTAGSGTDNGVGGSVKIKSGTAFSNGVAGAITITAANAGFGGGPIDITAGNSVNTGGANVTLGSGSGGTTNGSVIFNIAGTEKARIGGNGNVGIGTTVPNARMQVAGGDAAVTTQGNGLILRATDGANCYRATVNNLGVLTTALVACP